MTELSRHAARLDKVFKILYIALKVGIIASLVGLGIIAVGAVFDLAPEQIGTGFENIELGFLELSVAEEYMPDFDLILIYAALEIAMVMAVMIACRYGVGCVRTVLQPMAKGEPFGPGVSESVKKLAWLSVIIGIAVNLVSIAQWALVMGSYDVAELLIGEKITQVTASYTFDLSFLLVSAVLFLLHYVFRYGAQLQKLDDETL